jgi:hypothetical protein
MAAVQKKTKGTSGVLRTAPAEKSGVKTLRARAHRPASRGPFRPRAILYNIHAVPPAMMMDSKRTPIGLTPAMRVPAAIT